MQEVNYRLLLLPNKIFCWFSYFKSLQFPPSGQEITPTFLKPKFHCVIHKSPPPVHVLSQINPVKHQPPPHYSWGSYLTISVMTSTTFIIVHSFSSVPSTTQPKTNLIKDAELRQMQVSIHSYVRPLPTELIIKDNLYNSTKLKVKALPITGH